MLHVSQHDVPRPKMNTKLLFTMLWPLLVTHQNSHAQGAQTFLGSPLAAAGKGHTCVDHNVPLPVSTDCVRCMTHTPEITRPVLANKDHTGNGVFQPKLHLCLEPMWISFKVEMESLVS